MFLFQSGKFSFSPNGFFLSTGIYRPNCCSIDCLLLSANVVSDVHQQIIGEIGELGQQPRAGQHDRDERNN